MSLRGQSKNENAARLAGLLYERLIAVPLPDLYAKQATFVLTEAHHAAFVAGIGSGKSWAGAVRADRAAYGWIGKQRIKTPNLGVVTAPTYDMLKDATLRVFLENAGERVASYNKNDMLVTMKNGSEIIFRSTQHPDRLRGPSISYWWGDEAALYPPDVRKIMIGRLRQFGTLGWDWITTTPRGRNWAYQTFVMDHPNDADYFLLKARSRENTYLDSAIVEAWETEYTGDFAAQELEGEFVAFEGLIYSEFDRAKHLRVNMPQYPRAVAGVDWGFANPGVIMVCGVDSDGRMGVIHELYRRQMRIEEWVNAAVQLRGMYRIERFYCDPSSPDNTKKFVEAGLPAEGADNTVQTGIQMVKNRLVVRGDGQPRLTISHDAVNLVDEFESYQWAKNVHGLRDEPLKTKDHAQDALRYAIMGIDQPRVKQLVATTSRWA